MSGIAWTKDEDAVLIKYWPTPKKLVHFMGMLPGRTIDAMQDRADRLKLGKRKNVPRGGASWKLIEKQLKTGPKTALQISEKIGMKRDKVLEIIRQYKRNCRCVYIFAWTEPDRGGRSKIFALGNARDAPKPPSMTRPAINKAYIQRLKEERPDDYDRYMEVNRQRKREARKEVKADVASSWMFNPC